MHCYAVPLQCNCCLLAHNAQTNSSWHTRTDFSFISFENHFSVHKIKCTHNNHVHWLHKTAGAALIWDTPCSPCTFAQSIAKNFYIHLEYEINWASKNATEEEERVRELKCSVNIYKNRKEYVEWMLSSHRDPKHVFLCINFFVLLLSFARSFFASTSLTLYGSVHTLFAMSAIC